MRIIGPLLPLLFTVAALAQIAPDATPVPQPSPARPKRAALTYTPPKQAAAGTRVDGDAGTRAGKVKLPALYVLAPDHTGLTLSAAPSLFWFQSGPATARFELTLIEPKKPRPLLRVSSEQSEGAGVHRVRLGRHGIQLATGVDYKWTVALVADTANRSQDVIASGTIRRIDPEARLTAELAAAGLGSRAAVLAQNGIWYDAIEALSDQINDAPRDPAPRQRRAQLLAQAGLTQAAAADRR